LLKQDITDTAVVELMMRTYEAQQELSKGVTRLRELVATHPSSAPLQHLLGQWYARIGSVAEAQRAYQGAASSDQHFVPADLSLAQIDINGGRYDAARQRLGVLVATDPKNIAALLLSARNEQAAGSRSAAIASYRAVLNLDQSNLIALNNLANALAADDPDEAFKLAQKAAEMAPDSPNVQDTMGWVYYRKGLYSTAVRYLKAAVDKETTPRRQFHLGMTYLKVGDQSAGQKMVREALQKDPNLAKTEQGW